MVILSTKLKTVTAVVYVDARPGGPEVAGMRLERYRIQSHELWVFGM